jgi:acyl-CoA thioesterase-1
MRRFRLNPTGLVLAVCLALAGCGRDVREADAARPADAPAQAAPAPTSSEEGERPRVVALGDSLTAGYGLVETESYPALLQARIDAEGYEFEVVNAGVSGDTSAGGLRRMDWALDGQVRVLIVALGGNDALRGLSVGELEQNLTKIIEKARARNVAVILAGMEAPPNFGPEYTIAFRQVYRDVARRQRVLLIPFLLEGVAGQSGLNQPDGIHPNAQGTRIVADTVWSVLRPVLDQMATAS